MAVSVDIGPILQLTDMGCREAARVGAKAANLAILAGLHRVPEGFVLTAPAIAAARGELNATLERRVLEAYARLLGGASPAELPVAVRSSAVGEDAADASFAGQHETYLNVRGESELLTAIGRCLESARNQRALAYRRQHGIAADGVPMAVLVQALVRADVAAVVFSANPVTGDRGEVMINASWGLGESIVGGAVTPDTFVVRRHDGAITARQVAVKTRMTVCTDGGTTDAPVPRALQSVPSLSETAIGGLVALAEKLESHMGWPVDVECCIAGGKVHLLQCRPITTLS